MGQREVVGGGESRAVALIWPSFLQSAGINKIAAVQDNTGYAQGWRLGIGILKERRPGLWAFTFKEGGGVWTMSIQVQRHVV